MLFDLAATYTVTQLAAVMHELEFLGLLDLDRLESTMRRHRNRPGPNHRRCRQALILHRSGSAGTQSALERRAADSLLEHGAPMPEVTPAFRFGSKVRRPDLLFRDHHLAVEVDGSAVHGRSRTRNDDRIKQEQFASIGIDTLRIHEDTFDADVACVLAHLQTRELPRSRAVSGP
ncbi:MAG: hypothetical protein JWO69_164 [Thermoleophilia bacterium]|nr:hypothetical protein [Thermoleophilia bacterium]